MIHKTIIDTEIFKKDIHPNTEVFASENNLELNTLKQVSYILCSEGKNKNNHYWTREMLDSAAKGCINEPININHSREYDESPTKIVGHNIACEVGINLHPDNPELYCIKAYAVLYDYAYRGNEDYVTLLGLLDSDALRASMEVLYTDFSIVKDDGTVVDEKPDIDDLFSFVMSNKYAIAFDGDVKFSGSAFLLGKSPADPNAKVFEEEEEEEENDTEGNKTIIRAKDKEKDEPNEVEEDNLRNADSSIDVALEMEEELIKIFENKNIEVSLNHDTKIDCLNSIANIIETLSKEEVKILKNQTLPINSEAEWDGTKAKERVWEWAKEDINKYSKAFLLLRGDKENKSSYGFGVGDIIDGKLVAIWKGIVAAMSAIHGARSKPNLSESQRKVLHNHLAKYYKKEDEEVPEFK